MSSRVDWTVQRLQTLALRGVVAEDLLEHIVSSLGDELSPLTVMASLRGAFDVPLFDLRDKVEGWQGLDRAGCDVPTSEVVAALDPFVREFRSGRR